MKMATDNPFYPPGEYKRLFGNDFTKEFFTYLQSLNETTTCFMSRKYLKKNFEELEENEKYHLTVCGEIKGNE